MNKQIKPSTSLLTLLKQGFSVSTPDAEYTLEKIYNTETIGLFSISAEELIFQYPLSADGLWQAIRQINDSLK